MQPILKWAGGKEKELRYILPAAPGAFDNYFEPFVGGGAVFMAVDAPHYFINDFSEELTSLYRNIARNDGEFFELARQIDRSWVMADEFFSEHNTELREIYQAYRSDAIVLTQLKDRVDDFCVTHADSIRNILPEQFADGRHFIVAELASTLKRKMARMKELEQRKTELPAKDIADNLLTAVKGSLYMVYRRLYNSVTAETPEQMRCALFLFIRNYCYSGMFRYNDRGEFNVPYGGIAYNSKRLNKKLDFYQSDEVAAKMAATEIANEDFEHFLRRVHPTADDFVFLDPPYDSEFSTYAGNEFTREDHRRLAEYLINDCEARWMLVIKHTDFIFDLYNQPGINIREFDKEYLVSFMNRNDKRVVHLLITNY